MIIVHGDHNITGPYNPPSHKGIDIGWSYTEEDNKIYANCKGTVVYTEDGLGNMEGASGWGNYVLIKHPNGMYSRYAHLKIGVKVKVGQEVDENTVLGIMGDSGYAFGRHLHFEVQTSASANTRIDPTPYINAPIWKAEPTPKPEPQQFKFNVGDKVVLSGHLYKNANGEGQGVYKKDCVCTILLRHEGIKPYNVDADNPGSYEGWVAECNLRLYEEPKKKLDIGVKVKTIGVGNSQACGKGRSAKTGLVGTISNKLDGNPYPYLINDNEGPLGWYKAEDLEII